MSILGFTAEQVLAFLQLGISGVAFVFLAMSFSLLRHEQARKEEARDNILASIRQFSILSLVFAILVAVMMMLDIFIQVGADQVSVGLPEECKAELDRANLLAMNKQVHTVDSLHELLKNTIEKCQ